MVEKYFQKMTKKVEKNAFLEKCVSKKSCYFFEKSCYLLFSKLQKAIEDLFIVDFYFQYFKKE